MLPLRDSSSLRPGDVIIHPARGGAVVDSVAPHGAWVQLSERLDRSEAFLATEELGDGWRHAVPGGLFALSVLRPEEATALAQDDAGATLHHLAEELDQPVDREAAATWLVSRGLLPPGRTMGWWTAARAAAAERSDCELVGDTVVARHPAATLPDAPAQVADWLVSAPARQRFDVLAALSPTELSRALDCCIDEGRPDAAALLLRDADRIEPHHAPGLDRLASSGHRELIRALAVSRPDLVAGPLLNQARINGLDGAATELLATLPGRRRAALLMELLAASLHDVEALDIAESLIEDHGGMAELVERIEPLGDQPAEVRPPADGRWSEALHWVRGRSADTTMEMPSLHPTPLLRDAGRVSERDAFPISISLARALARRHAAGRCGGVRGARLHRAEWRVDLGPAEPGAPDDDVRLAMRTVAELLIGRVPSPRELDDTALVAHLRGLVPLVSPDWIAVMVRALGARPDHGLTDGLSLWQALEQAQAVARVRDNAPHRRACRVELGHDTHIGIVKSRLGQTNQDAVFFHQHGAVSIALVADGISISSAGSGNLASALLVQAVASRWEDEADLLAEADGDRIQAFLRQALKDANDSVCEHALRLAGGDLRHHVPMGTTAVAAVLRDGRAWIASLGDSRVYLLTSSGPALLTGDGNLRGDKLEAHQIGRPLDIDGDGAALTAYVGHFDEEDRPLAVPPQLHHVTMLPGETLLLCSDGLTDFASGDPVTMPQLLADTVAASGDDIAQAARRLTDLANAGGGGDNISVVLARILD